MQLKSSQTILVKQHREEMKINDTNKLKSAIFVVEDNGEDCVGHHSKQDGEKQEFSEKY